MGKLVDLGGLSSNESMKPKNTRGSASSLSTSSSATASLFAGLDGFSKSNQTTVCMYDII